MSYKGGMYVSNLTTDQWIVFGSENEEFGLSILDVYEIIFVPDITPVADSEKHMIGIINLRSSVIPVFDLRAMLGKGHQMAGKKQRVIVTHSGDRIVGLLVDYVSQVLRVDPNQLVEAPESLFHSRPSPIEIVYKYEHGIISKINLHQLLENIVF